MKMTRWQKFLKAIDLFVEVEKIVYVPQVKEVVKEVVVEKEVSTPDTLLKINRESAGVEFLLHSITMTKDSILINADIKGKTSTYKAVSEDTNISLENTTGNNYNIKINI